MKSNEPRPILETEGDDALRELFAAGRDELPDESRLAAIAAGLGAGMGPPSDLPPAGGAPSGGGGAAGAGATGGATGALATKVVVAAIAVGVAGTGLWLAARDPSASLRDRSARESDRAEAPQPRRDEAGASRVEERPEAPARPVASPDQAEARAAAPRPVASPDQAEARAVAPAARLRAPRTAREPIAAPVPSGAGPATEATAAPEPSGAGPATEATAAPEPSGAGPATEPTADDGTTDRATREAEVALLARAQSALRADPSAALDLLGEHARRFPSGVYAQERERFVIEALVRLGRRDDARARAAEFEARWPSSPHRRRIHVLLSE